MPRGGWRPLPSWPGFAADLVLVTGIKKDLEDFRVFFDILLQREHLYERGPGG